MKSQIPRSNSGEQHGADGPSKDQRSSGLDPTTECNGHMLILRVYRLLPLLYPQLLTHCSPLNPTDMKECPIQLGHSLYKSL